MYLEQILNTINMNYLEIRLYSVDIICPPFVFYIS